MVEMIKARVERNKGKGGNHMRNHRLTRAERERNARILNGIVDIPANHQDSRILAYGRAPYPLREQPDIAPPFPRMRVSAWCNSPAARSKWLDRLAGRVEPILVALLLVLCAMLLVLSVSVKVLAK